MGFLYFIVFCISKQKKSKETKIKLYLIYI